MNLLSILVFYSYERDIGLFTVLKSALFAASGLILPHEVKFLEEWNRNCEAIAGLECKSEYHKASIVNLSAKEQNCSQWILSFLP